MMNSLGARHPLSWLLYFVVAAKLSASPAILFPMDQTPVTGSLKITNVVCTYSNPGSYAVTLVVGGDTGVSINAQGIVVTNRPTPLITSLSWLSGTQMAVAGSKSTGSKYILIASTNMTFALEQLESAGDQRVWTGEGFNFTVTNDPAAPLKLYRVIFP